LSGLWLWLAANSFGHTVSAIAAITAAFTLLTLRSIVRARRRRAALEAYADREIARMVGLRAQLR
jgi:hypothetical protein